MNLTTLRGISPVEAVIPTTASCASTRIIGSRHRNRHPRMAGLQRAPRNRTWPGLACII